MFPAGWITAVSLSAAWPVAMIVRHGTGALALWTMHVADRLPPHPSSFAGEPWWEYVPGLLIQAMPWTPLALVGGWHSLAARRRRRARRPPASRHRWSRATGCSGPGRPRRSRLLSLATVKNAHYAIAAQVPWSIWAALGLSRLAGGWPVAAGRPTGSAARRSRASRRWGWRYGLGFWLLGPRLDRRGVEWAFYETAGRLVPPATPVTLLYDDWDRNPYESPFGPFPHDLAVRLFYLRRPAAWYSLGEPGSKAADPACGVRPPT